MTNIPWMQHGHIVWPNLNFLVHIYLWNSLSYRLLILYIGWPRELLAFGLTNSPLIQSFWSRGQCLLKLENICQHTQPFLWLYGFCPGQPGWAGTRRNIHPLTPVVVINRPFSVVHLLRSMAASLFNPRAWQSFSTISLQDLPLGLAPSTSYSIHFFTQSLSSFTTYAHIIAACFAVRGSVKKFWAWLPSARLLGEKNVTSLSNGLLLVFFEKILSSVCLLCKI